MERRETLPSAIERLIDELASVGTLELLLVLRDASPGRRAPADLCSTLRCPEPWARLQLGRLRDAGLVEGDPDGCAYAPASTDLAAAVDDLARLWSEDRRAITSRMLESPRARRRAHASGR
jgi:hypothetical protein